uniref:Uncharacterized protein n=1 Tax=uncultured marine virus TaxID=186617 RepID=A0A0F7L8A1_9VIRU|nr:hypothetical protein [uncultured marine virus]
MTNSVGSTPNSTNLSLCFLKVNIALSFSVLCEGSTELSASIVGVTISFSLLFSFSINLYKLELLLISLGLGESYPRSSL